MQFTIYIVFIFLYILKYAKSENDFLQFEYHYKGQQGSVKVFNNTSVIVVPDIIQDFTITCTSKCPVEWRLEKFRYTHFDESLRQDYNFRSTRQIDYGDFMNKTKYTYSTELHLSGSDKLLTGNYVCNCAKEPAVNRSVYIYWEGSSSSFLLQGGDHQKYDVFRTPGNSWVTLYCGVSKNDESIYLFKELHNGTVFESIKQNSSVTTDVDGFHLNLDKLLTPEGTYICSTQRNITFTTSSIHLVKYEVKNVEQPEKKLYVVSEYENLGAQSEDTIHLDKSTNTIICCSRPDVEETWSQLGYWCENAQKCNFFGHRLSHKDEGHNARDRNNTCSSFTMGHQGLPPAAIFRCSMPEWNAQGLMFFSLDSDAYFTGDKNIRHDSMVRVWMPIPLPNYIGASLSFNCSRSQYLFSDGLIWVGSLDDGTSFLIDRRLRQGLYRIQSSDSEKNQWIQIKFLDSSVKYISCLAPVWNSDEWWNSTMELDLIVSRKPSFDDLRNRKEVSLDGDETEIVLRCEASGVPLPRIRWHKDLSDIRSAVSKNISDDLIASELRIKFGKDMSRKLGNYICEASNSIGVEKYSILLKLKERGPGLIIGITVGLLLVFIIILAILTRKVLKQRKALRHLTEAEISEFEKGNPEALAKWKDDINGCTHLLPYNNEYEIPPINLVVDNTHLLGQGTFGIVMRGVVRKDGEDIPVAVKTIRPNEDVANFKVLLSELKIMAFIGHHENIVSLVGASSRNIRNRELKIAIEFCDNGSLFDFLRKNRTSYDNTLNPEVIVKRAYVASFENSYQNDGFLMQPEYENQPSMQLEEYVNYANLSNNTPQKFGAKELVLWSIQIANGMEFLASKRVVHADIATRNVLLTGNLIAKIGDFGLSKHLFEYSTYTKKTMALLPWKWMAIESLRDMEFSVMSDVWSYGVLLWELFTLAEVPYPGISWTSEFVNSLVNGHRLPKPQYASADIYEVLLKCMRTEPNLRPSFTLLKDWQTKIYQRISTNTTTS